MRITEKTADEMMMSIANTYFEHLDAIYDDRALIEENCEVFEEEVNNFT